MSQLFRLKNGTVLLSTEAPGGIYNSSQLKKIAELCSKELAIVKATEDQRLALFVKESEVKEVVQQLSAIGLGFRHYQDSLHQPISCLGELCEEHDQPAMATAMNLTKEIADIQLEAPIKIGINGCARCCTPCHTLDIAIVGDASGYRISMGGKTSQMPEFASFFAESVPPIELPKRIRAVIEVYKSRAEGAESLHDVIERCGVAEFVKVLAPYSQDAAQREDPFASPELDDLDHTNIDQHPIAPHSETDDQLDEIPIQLENNQALEDDLTMIDLEGDTELQNDNFDELGEASSSNKNLAKETEASASLAAAPKVDFETEQELEALNDEILKDSENVEAIETKDLADLVPEDDLDIGDDELIELEATEQDIDELSLDDIEDDSNLELGEQEQESTLDLELADDSTEDLGLQDPVEDLIEEDLDDSILQEDALEADLQDSSLGSQSLSPDQNLEEIPELDSDIAFEEDPIDSTGAQLELGSVDEFEDDLADDGVNLSDQEESKFEQKLHDSIEEESRLLATDLGDANIDERQAALTLLESPEADELDIQDDRDDSLHDRGEARQTKSSFSKAPDAAAVKPQPLNSKSNSKKSKGHRLSAITFPDGQTLRIAFESGDYLEIDLGLLNGDEERSFRFGELSLSVTKTHEGYVLLIDGMRLFHPNDSLLAVS